MEKFKKFSPHLIVILLFVGISFTYFSPVLQGKMLDMHDITEHKGMSKEVIEEVIKKGDKEVIKDVSKKMIN